MALVLDLHVQPGAKRTEVAGLHDGRLKVRLAAPPVEGKANEALIEFLSQELNVPRRSVRIASGAASRRKRVVVEGYTGELPWKTTSSGKNS
ncbi:MAG TPA: DUF167 domain-containing protein [Burkholderiales bacterium]|nr:DUF167 domain-containing protein [Burkholderiales bacterium]